MSVIFFTDRDLGRAFPEILEASGLEVRRHSDLFRHDAPDEEWLSEVGRNGWFAISRDRRIYYRPNEKEAVIRAKAALFVIVGKAPHRELAGNFVRSIRVVERFARRHEPRSSPRCIGRRGAGHKGSNPVRVVWRFGIRTAGDRLLRL